MSTNLELPTNMTAFCKVAFGLSAIGLMLALSGFTTWGQHTDSLAGLFFYLPFLWLLWICCALSPKWQLPSLQLWLLWWIIDFAILALFSSYAMRVEHWAHARGGDMVVLLAYFPVIMPTILLFSFLPKDFISHSLDSLVYLFGGGVGDAFAVWFFFSAIALLQSLAISYLPKWRRGKFG